MEISTSANEKQVPRAHFDAPAFMVRTGLIPNAATVGEPLAAQRLSGLKGVMGLLGPTSFANAIAASERPLEAIAEADKGNRKPQPDTKTLVYLAYQKWLQGKSHDLSEYPEALEWWKEFRLGVTFPQALDFASFSPEKIEVFAELSASYALLKIPQSAPSAENIAQCLSRVTDSFAADILTNGGI